MVGQPVVWRRSCNTALLLLQEPYAVQPLAREGSAEDDMKQRTESAKEALKKGAEAGGDTGYFTGRLLAGERPQCGYLPNHLPETTVNDMEVVNLFMTARS